MRFARYGLMLAVLIVLLACGGGGGGGSSPGTTVPLVGRVISVVTTGPLNPGVTVAAGGASTTTEIGDGSFSFDAPTGVSALTTSATSGFPSFTFNFPAATGSTDLGDLYIGPEKVRVTGTVRNSVTNAVIPNASISFAGRLATTNASGQFNLVDVAYSSTTQTGFWGIFGNATATGFFAADFNANGKTATGGVVTVEDILLVPGSDDPPGTPYNIYGQALPVATGDSATVNLLQGGTPIRTTTASANGTFYFWVPAGTYTIQATKGAVTSPAVSVTLTSNNQIVRKDVNF